MGAPVIIALVVVFLFAVQGYRGGVVKRILEIAGVFVTLILTARFATAVQPWMVEKTGVGEEPGLLLTWAVLFLAGLVLSRVLAGIISKVVRLTVLGWLDRWGGALVGAGLGVLVVSVLLVAASQVPGGDKIQSAYEGSAAGRVLFYAAPSVYEQVHELAGGDGDDAWSRVWNRIREKTANVGRDLSDRARSSARKAVDQGLDEARDKTGHGDKH